MGKKILSTTSCDLLKKIICYVNVIQIHITDNRANVIFKSKDPLLVQALKLLDGCKVILRSILRTKELQPCFGLQKKCIGILKSAREVLEQGNSWTKFLISDIDDVMELLWDLETELLLTKGEEWQKKQKKV